MTQITSEMLADMHDRRLRGETDVEIATRYNVKPMAVYQRLRRTYGLDAYSKNPGPANDNNPDRVTRMTARNGGCSSLSGKMPVSLVRIPSLDGQAVGGEGDGGRRATTGEMWGGIVGKQPNMQVAA